MVMYQSVIVKHIEVDCVIINETARSKRFRKLFISHCVVIFYVENFIYVYLINILWISHFFSKDVEEPDTIVEINGRKVISLCILFDVLQFNVAFRITSYNFLKYHFESLQTINADMIFSIILFLYQNDFCIVVRYHHINYFLFCWNASRF